MNISEYFAVHLSVFALGVGWSVIYYLGKKTLDSLHQKADSNFGKMEGDMRTLASGVARQLRLLRAERESHGKLIRAEMEKMVKEQGKVHLGLFVSRQEYGAFTSAMNHKLDSIYEIVKREGTCAK